MDPDHGRSNRRLRLGRTGAQVWIPLGLALFLCAPSAGASRLEGRVTFVPQPGSARQQASMTPYAGSLGSICTGTGSTRAAGENVRDVVLSLRGVPTSPLARTRSGEHLTMAQRGQMFEPRVLGIPIGTKVGFPNFDPIFHNVFSYSKTKRFDLGRYGQGKSETVTFDKPGLVKVFCELHSNMSAFIYVTETPWVVQPDDAGRFAMDGVPDGTYTLEIWHPERGVRTQSVTVSTSAEPVEITF